MTRATVGLSSLVIVPAILGNAPLTWLAIVAALLLAVFIGAWAGAAPDAVARQPHAHRARGRWLPSLGLVLPIPLPGPLWAFLTIFRFRR